MLALQVTKHGLILDFLSSFSGQVDFLHMDPEQASSYTEGTEVKLTWHTDTVMQDSASPCVCHCCQLSDLSQWYSELKCTLLT